MRRKTELKVRSGALVLVAAAALLTAAAAQSAPQIPRLLPVDAGLLSSFAFDPVNPDIVYVGTLPGPNKGRVYKSTDGGEHWRLISGRGWTWLGALAADPRHRRTLYAGTGNAVYKTTDGGQTWRAFNRGLLPPPGINRGEGWVDWLAVDPTNSNVLYEHDYANTIRKSLDGGKTWTPVLSLWRQGSIGALLLAGGHPSTLYAAFSVGGPGGPVTTVAATTTGAWRNTSLSVSGTWDHPPVVAFAGDASRGTIYVAVRGRVYSSTMAGASCQYSDQGLPLGAGVTGLAAGAGTVYAAFGAKGIYKTTDGGTWTQSWPDSGSAPGLGAGIVAVDPARPTTVYASAYDPAQHPTRTRILRSTDSGRTWTVVG